MDRKPMSEQQRQQQPTTALQNGAKFATPSGNIPKISELITKKAANHSSHQMTDPTAITSFKRHSSPGSSPGQSPGGIKRPISHMKGPTSMVSSGIKSLGMIPNQFQFDDIDADTIMRDQENQVNLHVDFMSKPAKSFLTSIKSRSRSKSPHKQAVHLPQDHSFYGLPVGVKHILAKKHITELYEWQDKLMTELLVSRCPPVNYIYSVPTSGGKTLVAELMMLDTVFNSGRNAIMILPYVAIVQEKVAVLNQFADYFPNLVVEEYAAQKGKIPPRRRRGATRSIYVATIEKAHLLISTMIETGRFAELGMIVVDELHLIGEGNRGGGLENLILKIKLASNDLETKLPDVFEMKPRILGMSATLSNMEDLKNFIGGEYWSYDFRPVELTEYLKERDRIYKLGKDQQGEIVPQFVRYLSAANDESDPSNITALVSEVVPNKSCLVFCPTKKHCESVALLLARLLPQNPNMVFRAREKAELIRELRSCNLNGIACSTLTKSIPAGVAYHHSGLTSEERQAIEAAYLKGNLSVIVCTSTLAAGVNLPAFRVIIRDAYVGRNFISKSQYTQMVGRAGRAGFGHTEAGESILMISSSNDLERLKTLFATPMVCCDSALNLNDSLALETLILDIINLGLVKNNDIIELCKIITNKTLFGIQQQRKNLKGEVEKNFWLSTRKLKEAELIKQSEKTIKVKIQGKETDITIRTVELTKLGQATVKGLVDLRLAKDLYHELETALRSFNLDTQLHMIYISTFLLNSEDYTMLSHFQGDALYDKYETLLPREKAALEVVGFTESDIITFRLKNSSPSKMWRLWVTLLINDLWKGEVDFFRLGLSYNVHRGTLQNLTAQLYNHANAILRFVSSFDNLAPYQELLPPFCTRLAYRASPDLAPLLELPNVKIGRAKLLASCGYNTVESISKCRISDLTSVIQFLSRGQAGQIIQGAIKIVKDKAEEYKEQANTLLAGIPSQSSVDMDF